MDDLKDGRDRLLSLEAFIKQWTCHMKWGAIMMDVARHLGQAVLYTTTPWTKLEEESKEGDHSGVVEVSEVTEQWVLYRAQDPKWRKILERRNESAHGVFNDEDPMRGFGPPDLAVDGEDTARWHAGLAGRVPSQRPRQHDYEGGSTGLL